MMYMTANGLDKGISYHAHIFSQYSKLSQVQSALTMEFIAVSTTNTHLFNISSIFSHEHSVLSALLINFTFIKYEFQST